jgi:hypothetical protein
MLKRFLLVASIGIFGSVSLFAQTKATSKAGADSSSKTSVSKGQKEIISSGTIVNAELMNSIDVRKSKVGDQAVLKTTKAIKSGSETVVAKGSTLVGRITEIQKRTKDNAQSRVSMLFEEIKGKELNAPISVSIISMTAARAAATIDDSFADAGLMTSSSTSAKSSGSSGGGLLGGVGNTVGGVINTTTSTAGNVVGGATQTVGSTVGGVTQTARNTVGTVGRTFNGIQISQAMGGSASGSTTLSSGTKDIRIEKGATFNVQFNSSVHN